MSVRVLCLVYVAFCVAFNEVHLDLTGDNGVPSSISLAVKIVSDGGVIIIPEGVFRDGDHCSLNISSSVTIRGAGMDKTVIHCSFYFVSLSGFASLTLEDLQVTGLSSSLPSITVVDGSLTLTRVHFSNNHRTTNATSCYPGGAISLNGPSTSFTATASMFSNNMFESLASEVLGGAVFVEGGTSLLLGCSFSANTAYGTTASGGAIAFGNDTDKVSIRSSSFYANTAMALNNGRAGGGAVVVAVGLASVDNVTFSQNSVKSLGYSIGAGLWGFRVLYDRNRLNISNSIFESNYGSSTNVFGVGLNAAKGHLVVSNTLFQDNLLFQSSGTQISDSAGAGVALFFTLSATLSGCTFSANTATNSVESGAVSGGALSIQGSDASLLDCSFSDNAAVNLASDGGSHAGCVLVGEGRLILQGCCFYNCSVSQPAVPSVGASSGGAIFVPSGSNIAVFGGLFQDCASAGNGGAVSLIAGQITFDSTIFLGNSAIGSGGAVVLDGLGVFGGFSNCTFANNTAPSSRGGAIAMHYPSVGDISHCKFEYNFASSAGAISANGMNVSVARSSFLGNSASYGGAITLDSEGGLQISLCSFTNNSATAVYTFGGGTGGAIWIGVTDTTVVISGSHFVGNFANPGFRQPEQDLVVGGGAIHTDYGPTAISDCVFLQNYVTGCSSLTSSPICLASTGACACGGGALLLVLPQAPVFNSQFVDNFIEGDHDDVTSGGAIISSQGGSQLVLSGCVLQRNRAYQGGAWYVLGGGAVKNCLFQDNVALVGGALLIANSVVQSVAVSLCGPNTSPGLLLSCISGAAVVGTFNMPNHDQINGCEFYTGEDFSYGPDFSSFICANTSYILKLAVSVAAIAFTITTDTPGVDLAVSIPNTPLVYPPSKSWTVHYPCYPRGGTVDVELSSTVDTRASLTLYETQCVLSLNFSTVLREDTLDGGVSRWSGEPVSLLVNLKDSFGYRFTNTTCLQPGPLFLASRQYLPHFPIPIDFDKCDIEGCQVSVSVLDIGSFELGLYLDGEFEPKFILNVRSWALLVVLPTLFGAFLVGIAVRQFILLHRRRVEEKAEILLHDYCGSISSQSIRDDDAALSRANFTIPVEDLHIIREVARGASGTVSVGMWQKAQVAVKKHHLTIKSEEFLNEALLHRTLNHPNIVQLFGICTRPLMSVMEWMHRGSLYHILHNEAVELSWERKLRLAIDAARGMVYLHNSNIIHRDLKSLNLLVDDRWVCKVGDFGLSRAFAPTMTIAAGTMLWTAPEVWTDYGHYTARADVYSFGIVLWELYTRENPFADVTGPVLVEIVRKGKRPTVPEDCPAAYSSIMRACWDPDADRRPSFVMVLDVLEAILRQYLRQERRMSGDSNLSDWQVSAPERTPTTASAAESQAS